jgi:hypothetical protein
LHSDVIGPAWLRSALGIAMPVLSKQFTRRLLLSALVLLLLSIVAPIFAQSSRFCRWFVAPGFILDMLLSHNVHQGYGIYWLDFAVWTTGIFLFWMIPTSIGVWWYGSRVTPMCNKSLILLAVAFVAVVLAVTIPRFLRARNTPSQASCINYLRQLDGAKQQWALENDKATNDVPPWAEITPYLKNPVACPQGGIYTLGRVGDLPTCSIGGESHTLPQ